MINNYSFKKNPNKKQSSNFKTIFGTEISIKLIVIISLINSLLTFSVSGGNSIKNVINDKYLVNYIEECIPPPPPLPVTYTIAPLSCGGTTTIDVTISGGVAPFVVFVYLANFNPAWYNIPNTGNGFASLGGLPSTGTYQVPNIPFGCYQLIVRDANNDSYTDWFCIADDNHFPVVPINNKNAYGVDVKCDINSYIFATGFFTGDLTFPNQATLYSGDDPSVYLACISQCGNVIWDRVIGRIIGGSCTVNSLSIDYSPPAGEYITICGQFIGTIDFPSTPIFSLTSTYPMTPTNKPVGFIARFDLNGNFIWAHKIDNPGPPTGEISVKGITADKNGHIIVMGDFSTSSIQVYDNSGPLAPLPNLGWAGQFYDNYYIIYDVNGNVLSYNNSTLSHPFRDDKAGGLCCYTDASNNTVVFFTGLENDNVFLGRRYVLTNPPFIFTELNIFSEPTSALSPLYNYHFGKSVDYYLNPNGTTTLFFAGTTSNSALGSEPFIFVDVVVPPPNPNPLPMDLWWPFVGLNSSFSNGATAIAIRHSTTETYFGGYTHDPNGQFPAGNTLCPLSAFNDFWINSVVFDVNVQTPPWPFWAYMAWCKPISSQPTSHVVYNIPGSTIPEFFGICVDENNTNPGCKMGKEYITGSYNSNFSPSLCGPNTVFPNGLAGATCYIARLVDGFNDDEKYIKSVNDFFIQNHNTTLSDNTVGISPNPTNNSVHIQVDKSLLGIVSVYIYSIDGRIVMTEDHPTLRNGELSLDLSILDAGVYFVKISDSKNTVSKKIIKL